MDGGSFRFAAKSEPMIQPSWLRLCVAHHDRRGGLSFQGDADISNSIAAVRLPGSAIIHNDARRHLPSCLRYLLLRVGATKLCDHLEVQYISHLDRDCTNWPSHGDKNMKIQTPYLHEEWFVGFPLSEYE